MTSMRNVRAVGFLIGAATFAGSHSTRADMTYYVNQTGSIDVANRDVDFTSPSAPTIPSGPLVGFKSWTLQLATNSNKAACFQVWTGGDGTGDTRFWVNDPNTGIPQKVNDDSDGTTLYARANVWVVPPQGTYQYVSLLVTGYSPFYNSMKFELIVHRLPTNTTEAQCTQGSTLKVVQGVFTFVNPT